MADFEIRIDTRRMQRLIQQEPQIVDQWLRGVANEMVADIVLSFGTSPPGRSYRRGNATHVASQPGYPPNVDSGTLHNAITSAPAGRLKYEIRAGTEYAYHLEMGTERMAARPFVGPVFDDWQGKIDDDARRNLRLD